jgi:hypothetical protein
MSHFLRFTVQEYICRRRPFPFPVLQSYVDDIGNGSVALLVNTFIVCYALTEKEQNVGMSHDSS